MLFKPSTYGQAHALTADEWAAVDISVKKNGVNNVFSNQFFFSEDLQTAAWCLKSPAASV